MNVKCPNFFEPFHLATLGMYIGYILTMPTRIIDNVEERELERRFFALN
jgi:hypothetical protein